MPKCKLILKNSSLKCWLRFRLFLWRIQKQLRLQFRSSFNDFVLFSKGLNNVRPAIFYLIDLGSAMIFTPTIYLV